MAGYTKAMFEIVRWSTLSSPILLAVVGYSDQIRLIFVNQSTAGLSFWMILLATWTWASYTLYGHFQKDRKIFWPNLLGTILIGIVLLGFFIF